MNIKKNILWNSVGSLYYLGITWLTTILVVRISNNYEDAGLYSLAMSVTNVFYIIAMYNVRNFQVSDIQDKYKEEDYIAHRITTMLLAMITCTIFLIVVYRESYTICVILCYMALKIGESFVDVFHGIDQKMDRMDIIGKSFLIRGTVMLVSFVVTEYLVKNLLITIIVMASTTIVAAIMYDVRLTKKLFPVTISFHKDKLKGLYVDCFSFLIYGMAMNIIATIPRIMTEKMYGTELLGYYASVATPAVIVQSLANVIFVPFINIYTKYYQDGEESRFWKLAGKMLGFCLVLGIVVYFGSVLCGRFLLENILYSDPGIGPYCYLLNTTMICTTMVAVIWLLVIFLTIDRASKELTAISLLGIIVEAVAALIFIRRYGIDGINMSLLFTYLLVIVTMGITVIVRFRKYFSKHRC